MTSKVQYIIQQIGNLYLNKMENFTYLKYTTKNTVVLFEIPTY
jgi:hypothetical protein